MLKYYGKKSTNIARLCKNTKKRKKVINDCDICCELYVPDRKWKNPRANKKCGLKICPRHVGKCYILHDHYKGQITSSYVVCKICNTMIDHTKLNQTTQIINTLYEEREFHNSMQNTFLHSSHAKLLCSGSTLWICNSDDCKDLSDSGLFFVDNNGWDYRDQINNESIAEWIHFGFRILTDHLERVYSGCNNFYQKVKFLFCLKNLHLIKMFMERIHK